MFRNVRVRTQTEKIVPDLGELSAEWLTRSPNVPITLRQINRLPESAKIRTYRSLLPPALLGRFGVNPVTWQGPGGNGHVSLVARAGSSVVRLAVRNGAGADSDFLFVELSDTSMNGINLDFLELRDPNSPCFRTDRDESGQATLLGTVRRNLGAEVQAMKAGLAPGQACRGLRASRQVLQHLEAFLVTIGHSAYSLEPLTYASAWLFEQRGFAYVRGHKLMDEINQAFRPGGRLYGALDGSTPFRHPDQWRTVRGRAWAIHDGILEAIGASWNGLRMIKQVGRDAGAKTFAEASY